MYGSDIVKPVEVAILLLLTLSSDMKSYKIKNPVVILFILIGILTNAVLQGYDGLLFSVIGTGTPVIILFFFFAVSMLGAGDIKLFSAIGSIVGCQAVIKVILYSFLAGGVIAAVLMIMRGNAGERFRYMFNYLKTCFMTFSFLSYTDMQDKNDGAKFRFSWAIAFGSVLSLFIVK